MLVLLGCLFFLLYNIYLHGNPVFTSHFDFLFWLTFLFIYIFYQFANNVSILNIYTRYISHFLKIEYRF